MERLDDEVESIRRLMAVLDGLAESPDVSIEVQHFAKEVRDKYEDLQAVMDESNFQQLSGVIRLPETIESQLRSALSHRRNAEVVALAGNATRIVGTLMPSQPIGDIMFWTGLTVSCICDAIAESAGHEAKRLVQQMKALLRNHESRLRAVAKAIRDLEDTMEAHTGMGLYDDELRAFLDNAAEDPEQAEEHVPSVVKDVDEKENLVAIARNRPVVKILKTAIAYAMKEDIAILTVISQGLNALSFMKITPSQSVALQVGEISLRGIILLIEYKRNSKTLSQFKTGIASMRKEYKALEVIYSKA